MTFRIFIGVDRRQFVAFHVLSQSIMDHATVPVAITPLRLEAMPMQRTGLTDFTYSRFLVPHLAGYTGRALFLDADMLVQGDVRELAEIDMKGAALGIVPTEPKFEQAAVMLFDCAQLSHMTPEFVAREKLFDLAWAPHTVSLPARWHHPIGYAAPPKEPPALLHYTMGIPCFPETAESPYREEWAAAAKRTFSTVPWRDLMGTSVHAKQVGKHLVPKYATEATARKMEAA